MRAAQTRGGGPDVAAAAASALTTAEASAVKLGAVPVKREALDALPNSADVLSTSSADVRAGRGGFEVMSAATRKALSERRENARVSAAAAFGKFSRGHRKLQETTCGVGSGVSVTSSEFPLLEGCLDEIDLYINSEFEFISSTGIIISGGTGEDPATVGAFVNSTSCYCFMVVHAAGALDFLLRPRVFGPCS